MVGLAAAVLAELRCEHQISVAEGAGQLFEEPGTLETVVRLLQRGSAPPLVREERA